MNPEIVIVADDFTGGNAVAANLATHGVRVANVALTKTGLPDETMQQFDAVVLTTSSRNLDPFAAASRVAEALSYVAEPRLVSNRIDTTLRGNVSTTTAAVLRVVRSRHTNRVTCLCVPAHPAAGRQTVGARQLLRGSRLEDSELVSDPLHPAPSSDVVGALQSDESLSVSTIGLDAVTGPIDELAHRLRIEAATTDVLVVDALTEQHLDRIADAASRCVQNITWVTADPGPFTASLARALGLLSRTDIPDAPILAVSGSATTLTRKQLQRLMESRTVRVVPANSLASPGDAASEQSVLADARHAMVAATAGEVVLIATVLEEAHVQASPTDVLAMTHRLANVAVEAAKTRAPAGLYVTGGDVTAAVLDAFQASGLAVHGEVLPLAVSGSLLGGPWVAMPIVTKGGLVGDDDAAVACIAELESRIQSQPFSEPVGLRPVSYRIEGES